MIIGRNPNASWLSEGITEPAWSSNLMVKAAADKIKSDRENGAKFSFINGSAFLINKTARIQPANCMNTAITTSK